MKELPDLSNAKIAFNATTGLQSNAKIPTHYQTTQPTSGDAAREALNNKLNSSSIKNKNSLNGANTGLHEESITHH